MKLALLSLACLTLFSLPAQAESIFRIEFGENYKNYSQSEMRRRIWELERAVWQLQQKVFQLENSRPIVIPSPRPSLGWVCKVKAMGNTYTGAGDSRAVAKMNALEACKSARNGNAFFCEEDGCEQ